MRAFAWAVCAAAQSDEPVCCSDYTAPRFAAAAQCWVDEQSSDK